MSNAIAITIVYTIAVIATNVPADIYSNNVLLATILWNQTFTGWVTRGTTFDFDATVNRVVFRTTGTSGFIVIDAMRFTPMP
jgi:hypothetical protein